MADMLTDGSGLRLAVVTDSYAPQNTSAAVQLASLCDALGKQGHTPVIVMATAEIERTVVYETVLGIETIRLKMPFAKGQGYVKRLLFEILMPFVMWSRWAGIYKEQHLDGVIWYSPSIFHGFFIRSLKRRHSIPGYLILRDIFPDWAADVGLIKRYNPLYWVFKFVERYQYRTANVIGVQSPGNLVRIDGWVEAGTRSVEVLNNWYSPGDLIPCQIDLEKTRYAGRKVFVYAGNIGVAQDVDLIIDLAESLKERSDIAFLFVGRGKYFDVIKSQIMSRELDNVMIHDEIPSNEIPALYAQCYAGIVSLNIEHTTHNIPGKFISYLAHGLPVLAAVNPGNDLIEIITQSEVGITVTTKSVAELQAATLSLLEPAAVRKLRIERCKSLYQELYDPMAAAHQITHAFRKHEG